MLTLSTSRVAGLFSALVVGSKRKVVFIESLKTKRLEKLLFFLLRNQFIADYHLNPNNAHYFIITLRYSGPRVKPFIKNIKCISTPGQPISFKKRNLASAHYKSLGGRYVLDTQYGLLLDTQALNKNVGGKPICYIML